MTPREPDRYEEKARELLREIRHGVLNVEQAALHLAKVAAALRAEHDDALERAAQWCESQIAGPDTTAQNRWIASRIRALKSPAAAPAAEVEKVTPELLAAHAADLAAGRHDLNGAYGCSICGTSPAPPSEPAAPAPLLPRVLAALEQEASAHDDFDSTYEHAAALAIRALAAELRAYIAERDDLLRECEEAIRDSFLQFDGRRFKALLPKLAARAARAKGEGT